MTWPLFIEKSLLNPPKKSTILSKRLNNPQACLSTITAVDTLFNRTTTILNNLKYTVYKGDTVNN